MVLDKYAHFKEELLRCIDSILTIESISNGICEELREQIENNVFNLVVLGQFKRGKTSLINALLGAEIFLTAVVPLTSIATILKYGETLNIKVYFNDGRVEELNGIDCEIHILSGADHDVQKEEYVKKLGTDSVVAFGADAHVTGANIGLDFLLHSKRCKATLRY